MNGKDVQDRILSTFADLAVSLGYAPIHGKIIGVLLIKGEAVSLQELARGTGYSTSMVSISLDLLEVLGVVKKVKKTSDRKLYLELSGDLLSCLKNALLVKVKKGIDTSLSDFRASKEQLQRLGKEDRERISRTLNLLEREIKRLDRYVSLLSKIKLP